MDQELPKPADPATIQRELSEAIERTEQLSEAIEACLDDAERELEAIRHTSAARRW